jgi:hypothetical protein
MTRCRTLIGLVACGLFFAGCGGGSLCDRASDSYENLAQKVGNCDLVRPTFNKQLCEQSESTCSDTDNEAITAYFDCLNGVQTCQPGGEDGFLNQVQACADANSGVSTQACSDAFASN